MGHFDLVLEVVSSLHCEVAVFEEKLSEEGNEAVVIREIEGGVMANQTAHPSLFP